MSETLQEHMTLQVLIDARKLIEQPENWYGGGQIDWGLKHCSLSAIGKAEESLGLYPGDSRAANALRVAAEIKFVSSWNDAPNRTHADILAAFDKAIAAERARLDPPMEFGE